MQSILYIDDEPRSLTAFKLSFGDEFRIFTAENTQAGYEILKQNEIQLIVTDQSMPDETGVEFLNRIRDEFPKSVRTILTGYSDLESVLDAINKCHIYYYFKKPWNEEELKIAFRNAIEVARLSSENRHLFAHLQQALADVKQKSTQLEDRLKEREELVESLRLSSEAKSSFLSVMSHELRTPLNPIIGLSEIITKTTKDDDVRTSTELINRSGKNLLGMINSIMEFVQHGRNSSHQEIEPVDLTLLIKDSIVLAKTSLSSNSSVEVVGKTMIEGIETNNETFILSSSRGLRQILQNLVANACKFTNAGSISLSANLKRTPAGGAELELSVADTGIGIADENKERIFEAFSQVDQSLSRTYSGLGLGLAICKQVASALKGDLKLESEIGEGSVFRFELHLEESQQFVFGIEDCDEQSNSLKGSSCLVAESDPNYSALMQVMLRALGASVTTSSSGRETLNQLTEQEVDIVFIDLLLPDIDGYQLAEKIKDLDLDKSPRLVILCPGKEKPQPQNIADVTVDSCLYKPLTFSLLSEHFKESFRSG